jgi:CCR4-NOT transcription complex subunit 6
MMAVSSGGFNGSGTGNVQNEESWDTLDMSQVGIHILSPALSIYTHIKVLFLGSNNLSTLPGEVFEALVHLSYLDASYNRLSSIPPQISRCIHLEELYLHDNRLAELPMEMGRLFRLKTLSLDRNPLMLPPGEVIQQGTRYVISFMRERMPAGAAPAERAWIQVKEEKPYVEKLRVFTYNMLAQEYAVPDRYTYCPVWALEWNYRKIRILKEMMSYDAEILCLQEVESEQYRSYFEPAMQQAGYSGVFRPKSRARTMEDWSRVDGCAIFFKNSKFLLVEEHVLEFQSKAVEKHEQSPAPDIISRLMPKDNIAVIAVLQLKDSQRRHRRGRQAAAPKLIVSNAHIHWDPEYADVKLLQVHLLIEELVMRYGNSPMVICGDFNSSPDSGPYELLRNGYLAPNHRDLGNYDFGMYNVNGFSHPLKLSSAYETVGEPAYTNYTGDFVGVIDYIWYTNDSLELLRMLEAPDIDAVKSTYLPNPHWCSDHIPLAAEVAFKY